MLKGKQRSCLNYWRCVGRTLSPFLYTALALLRCASTDGLFLAWRVRVEMLEFGALARVKRVCVCPIVYDI
jgi:hypothetical protein